MNAALGQVMTPQSLAIKMVTLLEHKDDILEPSCGTGVFLDLLPNAQGIEIDPTIVAPHHAGRVTITDFLTSTAKFTSIIGNPPYIAGTPYNLYLQFMLKAVELLKPNGELVFVVPHDLFMSTTGSQVITKLLKEGCFTYIELLDYIPKWTAAVEVCIFRFVKQLDTPQAISLYSNAGFVFLPPFAPHRTLSDFFKFKVGAAIKKSLIGTIGLSVYDYDKYITVLDTKWPRNMQPIAGPKILMHAGPTRRQDVFKVSNAELFTCHSLLPKQPIDLHQAAKLLNEWGYWDQMLLRRLGRWRSGLSRIAAMPIDEALYNQLKDLT